MKCLEERIIATYFTLLRQPIYLPLLFLWQPICKLDTHALSLSPCPSRGLLRDYEPSDGTFSSTSGYWLQSRNVINMSPGYCNQLLPLPATHGMGSSGPGEVKLLLAPGAESLVFSPQTAGQCTGARVCRSLAYN